jgi:hypothetical protein
MRIEDAARLLREGKVSAMDLGQLVAPGPIARFYGSPARLTLV